MSGQPKNILIIKPGAIGDLLHISPTIRALKKKFPAAEIDVMVGSRATVCLFENSPHIRNVLFFDRKGVHKGWHSFRALWSEVRRQRYDLVINFQRSTLKVWLLILAAFPCQVLVYHKSKKRKMHAVTNHLETVAPLGIDPERENHDLELHLSVSDNVFAEKLVNDEHISGRQLIALNLGASNRIKCWAPHSFAQLGDRLASDCGAAVLLIGGHDELDLADEVMGAARVKPHNLVGRMSLTQLGAVLHRCDLLVSGDTGPLHLATAVGTRVIGLFGAIDPMRTGPVGTGHTVITHPEIPCVPCNDKQCRHIPYLECMERITVDEVMHTVKQMVTPVR